MSRKFREAFLFANKEVAHYFPGHMTRGMRQMQQTLKDVDAIVEVHDARIPFSGRNPYFEETINLRPHMLVLNKMDLTDMKNSDAIFEKLKGEGISKVLYTNCKEQTHISIKNEFIPEVLDLLQSVPRFHRSHTDNYNLLVIGVPNVGKSSLINSLRRTHLKKGKAARVGAVSGITRSVEEKIKVSESPAVYVFDSPGILAPRVEDIEAGMKLAACNTLKDHLVGEDLIVDYVLYWLNKHNRFEYVKYFDLPEPVDDVYQILGQICRNYGFSQKSRVLTGTGANYSLRPNYTRAANFFLKAFREGQLGKINMDEDVLDNRKD